MEHNETHLLKLHGLYRRRSLRGEAFTSRGACSTARSPTCNLGLAEKKLTERRWLTAQAARVCTTIYVPGRSIYLVFSALGDDVLAE